MFGYKYTWKQWVIDWRDVWVLRYRYTVDKSCEYIKENTFSSWMRLLWLLFPLISWILMTFFLSVIAWDFFFNPEDMHEWLEELGPNRNGGDVVSKSNPKNNSSSLDRYQLNSPDPVTPIMFGIHSLHNHILFFSCIIFVIVSFLLGAVLYHFSFYLDRHYRGHTYWPSAPAFFLRNFALRFIFFAATLFAQFDVRLRLDEKHNNFSLFIETTNSYGTLFLKYLADYILAFIISLKNFQFNCKAILARSYNNYKSNLYLFAFDWISLLYRSQMKRFHEGVEIPFGDYYLDFIGDLEESINPKSIVILDLTNEYISLKQRVALWHLVQYTHFWLITVNTFIIWADTAWSFEIPRYAIWYATVHVSLRSYYHLQDVRNFNEVVGRPVVSKSPRYPDPVKLPFDFPYSKIMWLTYLIAHKQYRVTHNLDLEVIRTIIPTIILIIIALPSFALLYSMDELIEPTITVKVVGHQWYWSYEYSDFKPILTDTIKFDSYMVPESDLLFGELRLLKTDCPLILPSETNIRFLITATDVLHSWAVPAFGIKMDAVPGRLNQANAYIMEGGRFYGQCSELCGVNHGFMPTEICVIEPIDYYNWIRVKLA